MYRLSKSVQVSHVIFCMAHTFKGEYMRKYDFAVLYREFRGSNV